MVMKSNQSRQQLDPAAKLLNIKEFGSRHLEKLKFGWCILDGMFSVGNMVGSGCWLGVFLWDPVNGISFWTAQHRHVFVSRVWQRNTLIKSRNRFCLLNLSFARCHWLVKMFTIGTIFFLDFASILDKFYCLATAVLCCSLAGIVIFLLLSADFY